MKSANSYCLETRDEDGRWRLGVFDHGLYSRDPVQIARSVLEQWIIGHPGELEGGERISILRARDEPSTERVAALDEQASVRVQVYAGNLLQRARRPEAVAYLGFDERGYHRVSTGPAQEPAIPRPRGVLERLRRRLSGV